MPRTTKTRSRSGDEKSLKVLIGKAMRQPGVAELMRVYRGLQDVEEAFHRYDQMGEVVEVVTASGSTEPLPW